MEGRVVDLASKLVSGADLLSKLLVFCHCHVVSLAENWVIITNDLAVSTHKISLGDGVQWWAQAEAVEALVTVFANDDLVFFMALPTWVTHHGVVACTTRDSPVLRPQKLVGMCAWSPLHTIPKSLFKCPWLSVDRDQRPDNKCFLLAFRQSYLSKGGVDWKF